MVIRAVVAAFFAFFACVNSACAAENIDELKKQKAAAEEKLKELNAKFDAARGAAFKSPEFAALAKKVDEAMKARDAKAAADPKVIEARKAVADASAAAKKISDDELAASPEAAEILKQIAASDESIDDLKSQERIAQFIFGEVLRKAAKDPELKKLDQAQQDAVKAAAGKAADSPEKQAATAAKKAFDDAVKAKASARPQGAEQLKKIDELKAQHKTAVDARTALDKKLMDIKRAVFEKSEKIAAARKAEASAMTEANKIAGEQAKTEKDALTAARKEYDDARQAKLAADPTAVGIRKEIDESQKQIREINIKIRDAEKAAK